jgi:hypothetical protein
MFVNKRNSTQKVYKNVFAIEPEARSLPVLTPKHYLRRLCLAQHCGCHLEPRTNSTCGTWIEQKNTPTVLGEQRHTGRGWWQQCGGCLEKTCNTDVQFRRDSRIHGVSGRLLNDLVTCPHRSRSWGCDKHQKGGHIAAYTMVSYGTYQARESPTWIVKEQVDLTAP